MNVIKRHTNKVNGVTVYKRKHPVFGPKKLHIICRTAIILIKTTFNKTKLWSKNHKPATRIIAGSLALLMLFSVFYEYYQWRVNLNGYKLSAKAETLLKVTNESMAKKLQYDTKSQIYVYNRDYQSSQDVSGLVAGPRFNANFYKNPKKGIDITDPVNKVSVNIKPDFNIGTPVQDKNRIIYPISGKRAAKVYTLATVGTKEDIVIEDYQGDSMTFGYDLQLPSGLEARLESNGSVAIYGVQSALLGNASASSENDQKLLDLARQNGKKTNLLFTFPAPYIKEINKNTSSAKAWFELSGKKLTVHATGLKNISYPASIDPSIYVETAAKLMKGNNETNVDFDVDYELIQKSQTTGARIDAWQGSLDMSEATWDHATAAAGGYIYRAGGRIGPSKPQIVDQQLTIDGSNGTTFTMNMPATRPAGDLYIALISHAGTTAVTPPAGGGWTEYADSDVAGGSTREHAAYYKIGTNQGGGNEAATYSWTGGNVEWAGVIIRVTGFNSSDPVSGTPGRTSGSGIPQFPATTPDNDATLVIRAVGANRDNPSATGWVPTGHTKISSSSSSSGGNGSSAILAATLDTPPLSGVSSGTATMADSSISDTYGASTIAINPSTTTSATRASVNWAKFNSTSRAIESPNPGNGACSGWCSDSAYDLPSPRRGHSMVAYNGYLYVIGGLDGATPTPNRTSTVYVAKLGANGEPQLWHPSGGTPGYWFTDAGLNAATAKSYLAAVAYNNRMYILGGQTNASAGGVTTVEYADIHPNGTLGTWTAGTSLPAGAGTHMQSVHIYNDVLYTIGGFEGVSTSSANLRSAVYYNKLNSDGSMNTWKSTTGFTTARATFGGSYSTIWGAYIYLAGGCTAVNASGYCTTVASDTQIGSINADGTISEWGSISNLQNQRIGYNIIGWQGGLYRLGGCVQQNTSTGGCVATLADVDYGVINPAGEVSTVSISSAYNYNGGTPIAGNPCSGYVGGSPLLYNCSLPPVGDSAGQGGQMLSMTTIMNGYLYVIGGCVSYSCDNASGNTSYAAINSNGQLTAPAICGGTFYGTWCVDSTNRINGTTGVAAGGVTTFSGRIYVVGGLNGTANATNIFYNSVNNDGSLAGAWATVDMTTAGITRDVSYTFAYARANPASAGTNPGNLYIFGGCGTGAAAGCSGSDYRTEVYKCNINTAGAVVNGSCTTSNQLQIDSTPVASYPGDTDLDGLGIHSGTVYANYIFLIGGYSQNEGDKDDVLYAKFDNNNNVVAVSGSDWIESSNKLSIGRRRGFAFGYNGHVYAVGGYEASGTQIIPFIEWSKMNVSDGSINPFVTSSITINQRWGLSMVVSNAYAYVIGGCDNGASPGSCSSFEPAVQTFQLYNNNSGSANNFTAQSDQTFTADTDRWGASSTVYNGYLYVAGGCISATDCTDTTNSVQYAPISASDGSIGTWAAGGNLPLDRAWGSLEVAGGTLYYIGGQDDTATNEQTTVYYTSGISAGNPTWNATAATNGLPGARTKFGSAVWNNRLYVVGGLDGNAAATSTVYASPQLNSGGNITSAWASTTGFNVARSGTAVTTYANNLYLFGGYDGSNYLSDTQYTQINSDGTVDNWSYSTRLPSQLRDAKALSANGYIYLIGGRTGASACYPNTIITPISANTTIASGNNPTGVGEWYETNIRYPGGRYGAAIAYDKGKIYTMGGGCTSPIGPNYSTGTISQTTTTVTGSGTNWTDNYIGGTITYQDASTATIVSVNSATSLVVSVSKTVAAGQTYSISVNRHFESTVKSQPQVATYSRMIDTDTDVFPTGWLMNGLDNDIGARWQVKYRSMHDLDAQVNPSEDCGTSATMPTMTTWGQETNFGNTTLGKVELYTPKNSTGGNINCARYFYFYVSIDASKTFGYPEDVNRGPTIADLSLFFTSDPSKRMRHGKTFTGGEQQPLDTPCRYTAEQPNCPVSP